jgi:archaeosine-15-forming tRNA-guanine transglycosylase
MKGARSGGMGLKVSDYRTVPFCHLHHSEYHQKGRGSFEAKYNVDLREEIINALEAYVVEMDGL